MQLIATKRRSQSCPRLSRTLFAIAICIKCASPQLALGQTADIPVAESTASSDVFYCQNRKLGYWFYCEKPKPAPKAEPQAPPPNAVSRLDAITAELRELKARAILEPTNENVIAYVRFQRAQLDRASLFSDVWQRAIWQDPDLDYTLQRPVSTLGKRQWQDARTRERNNVMQNLGRRYGLFYFFAQSCGACEVMSPIVQSVAGTWSITVRAISTDGGPSRHFPNYTVETTQRSKMGLEGIFTDYAAAKHGCGTRGQRTSTTEQGAGKYDDVNTGVPRNYTWTILKKSAFFSPNGTFDRELAEYAMTLIGTIIYVPPKDDEPGKFVPFAGDASSTLVTALLDGTQGSAIKIFDCDEPDKCLNPTFKSLSLPTSKALRPRVAALIEGMVQAIRDDTPITEAQKELLQVASVPLYKILTVQAAYGRGMPTDDRETLAEIASVDLLFAVLDRIVGEAGRSMSSFIGADEAKIAMWQGQMNAVRQSLADRQTNTHLRVNAIMQIIEKTAFIENVLAAQMSPGMAASLDWSRAVQNRALVN